MIPHNKAKKQALADLLQQAYFVPLEKIKIGLRFDAEQLNGLGVKNCLSCEKPIAPGLKGFIIAAMCFDCIKDPKNEISKLILAEWKRKKERD